jgi:hypothetical protein
MEGNGENARAPGRYAEVSRPEIRERSSAPDEDLPAPTDPVVHEAIASLRRVQVDAFRRASDITQLLARKRVTAA